MQSLDLRSPLGFQSPARDSDSDVKAWIDPFGLDRPEGAREASPDDPSEPDDGSSPREKEQGLRDPKHEGSSDPFDLRDVR